MAASVCCDASALGPGNAMKLITSRYFSPCASSVVAGAGNSGTFSDLSASCGVNYQDLASSSGRVSGSFLVLDNLHERRWSWNVGFSGRNSPGRQRKTRCNANLRAHEEAATVKEIADLSENLLSLKGVVSSEYRAIGPEMRERVDRLYDRVTILQESADRAVTGGSRIPTQLTAGLIALQREHGSLENIVRLALEAGPALASLEAAVGRSSKLSDAVSNLLLEEAKPKASVFQSLILQSAVEPLKKSAKYVMSTAASQGSSPLAAFKAEIERRVIEQLAGKKMDLAGKSFADLSCRSLRTTSTEHAVSGEHPLEAQAMREAIWTVEENQGPAIALGVAEVAGTVTLVENKIKQLELELAKSIPLPVFEHTVSKINDSLSEARAKVIKLTAEVLEKEVMLAAVKRDLLAEQEELMQRVRQLTGDLEKTFSVEDIEAAVNLGLQEVERELEEEQDRAFQLSIELEKNQKLLVEQQDNWTTLKEKMEKRLEEEQTRTHSLSLELEKKDKLMIEHEEMWKIQKIGLESDVKTLRGKMHEIRKKRTKERAELAEKKKKVKVLEQELARVQVYIDEADRIRLQKESMFATVRLLISQMVESARARAESEAHASTLVQEVAKLQDEKQVLELTRRAAEEKAGLVEMEAEVFKSSLTNVGKEVAYLQGELLSGKRAAALEKFFAVMAQLINQESESIQESSFLSLETDCPSEDELESNDG